MKPLAGGMGLWSGLPMMRFLLLALLWAGVWAGLAGGVAAQPAADAQRRAAEAQREAATAEERRATAEAEAERLATERVESAARTQAAERAVLDATDRAEALATTEAAARAEVAQLAERIAPLLPLLMRVAREPAPLLLAAPLPPDQVTIGLAALRGMVREAQRLARDLREAEALAAREGAALAEALEHLTVAQSEARAAASALDAQFEAAQRTLTAETRAERAAAAAAETAVARAASLAEALARVERAQAAAQARIEARAVARAAARVAARDRAQAAAEARAAARAARREAEAAPPTLSATTSAPVVGRVVRGFGAPGEGGPARGLTFSAAPNARVVTPCAGTVAFAAPFRSYGRLVIVECGAGRHLVLAGMARLDVEAGQRLRAGEPVGVLGASGRPTLYVELRQQGEAVDPRPLLRI
jgi:septal ring factor EnvC (AmiA/AmiB activator)